MLRKLGPQERIYNEIKTIEDTSFRFAIEEPAADLVEELAENMQFYPPEDYITGSELYFEYDPEAIKMVLEHLKPGKMNVIVLSSQLPAGLTFDKTEPWFGTKYTEQGLWMADSHRQLGFWFCHLFYSLFSSAMSRKNSFVANHP